MFSAYYAERMWQRTTWHILYLTVHLERLGIEQCFRLIENENGPVSIDINM